MINSVFIKRQNKVIVKEKSGQLSIEHLGTFLKNIESLGFTFSRNVQDILKTYNLSDLVEFYEELLPTLKSLTGADKIFKPMYPNFPTQVMNMVEAELYINAILHYYGSWIGVRIIPEYEKQDRSPLLEHVELKVIGLGTYNEFHEIFMNLMSSKTSISQSDKEDLAWYIITYQEELRLPESIPYKEILSFVAGVIIDKTDIDAEEISRYFKTSTDVLRLAVALSDGDVSLAAPTKFISFKRKIRRFLLTLLEKCDENMAEDMHSHKMKWIRLGERLHPTEYRSRFPKSCDAFDIIRNNQKILRFNSLLEQYLLEGDKTNDIISLLKRKPGVFARRLDHFLRISEDKDYIIRSFAKVVYSISTPVLLQLMTHFKYRNTQLDLRIFFPKGNASKIQAIPNNLPEIASSWCEQIVNICQEALIIRFSERKKFGNVYLDEALKDYIVPFSQRSANKTSRTLVRGSRLNIPEGNTIRFFLWWKEGKNSEGKIIDDIDIDLSALMFDEDWSYKTHISYTNLKSLKFNAFHSGDLTSAPDGAAEFIDLDIESALNQKARYIIMLVMCFTSQSFSEIPESFAGFMIRKEPNSGEIFEPKTVQNKIDVISETRISIPLILDLYERKIIWADLALSSHPKYNNNIEGNLSSAALMGKSIKSLAKTNLYDLFSLHIKARNGTLVQNKEEADLIFSIDEGITPFDIEKIMAEFL